MIPIPDDAGALIFDCDGTLVDTLPLYLHGWRAAFRTVEGIDLPPSWFTGRGGLSERLLIAAFTEETGRTVDAERIITAARAGVIEAMPTVREIGSVADVARRYHGRIPLGVASSGSRAVVERSLSATGLLPLFQALTTIEDVERPKPAPDVYRLAARRLGVAAEACVVLEDSHEGLTAARAAGMRGIDIRDYT
ncbi:phosphatase/phosphohexomutase [Ameyamaea chiangmaiensis NBRC 103196]|uniref:HAD family phosphatase n=1 Tax=Ameyamaea chiangmaiensis TaxID=442969 RepID=A0A850PDQ4_9PROT|nr:HAD family phosphatase [Ameyamaea chiangmaiensis]MBS4074363.1 HAD family phosphatase [Ameyamaea chiangmaiensis]NVN41023.1 HAD family phosphatase [Ameyamaea chiangmaiensis]GBQ71786.1 phosphatase/phosphohexomutase [Ameyamaea chiangmaiensis NBRC 103196]